MGEVGDNEAADEDELREAADPRLDPSTLGAVRSLPDPGRFRREKAVDVEPLPPGVLVDMLRSRQKVSWSLGIQVVGCVDHAQDGGDEGLVMIPLYRTVSATLFLSLHHTKLSHVMEILVPLRG